MSRSFPRNILRKIRELWRFREFLFGNRSGWPNMS